MNRIEKVLMNNPVRSAVQRHFEVPKLLKMGGKMHGGRALEIGCGRGVGTELILDFFGAEHVDAFDLDPEMISLARERLKRREQRVTLWIGDATKIRAEENVYDAVFDFGIIHHIPDWDVALREVCRVLKPKGRFYGEEVFNKFITSPFWKRVLDHPQENRFDHDRFKSALIQNGLRVIASDQIWSRLGFFIAEK